MRRERRGNDDLIIAAADDAADAVRVPTTVRTLVSYVRRALEEIRGKKKATRALKRIDDDDD